MKQFLLFFTLSIFCLNNINAQILWQNTIGGDSFDYVEDIIVTSDGGFLLIGMSESNISGDKSENLKGEIDYWIVKTNNLGVVQWDKTFGGSGEDYPVSGIETSDGGFVIVGESNSNISGDKSENSKGGYDYWVLKINNTGAKVWDKTFGGSDDDYAIAIRENSSNELIISGDSFSDISSDKSENSRGFTDIWTIKTSSIGTLVWDKTLGGDADEELTSLELTSDGGYILGSIAESGISGDKTVNTSNNEDYWVIKLSSTNTIDWQKTYGGSSTSSSALSCLIPTTDGGYLLAGDSDSDIGGEKTENSNGNSDLWFIKINGTGVIQWQNTIGGAEDDYVPYGFEKSAGGFVFAAESLSNISGDKTENSNNNSSDIWLIELNSNGNLIADKTFGTNSSENPEQIVQTSDGNFVIASTIDELSIDNTEAPNGETDYWLFKVDKNTLSIIDRNDTALTIYPNPTNHFININSNSTIKETTLLDLNGRIISKFKSSKNEIDISNFVNGIYLLQIKTDVTVITKRIVKY